MQSEFHWPDPPIQLDDVMGDREAVVSLLERNAPYHPLGGWFRPDQDDDTPSSRMWFQKTLMGGEGSVEGSDMFVRHERVLDAMRNFYRAEVVVPHTLFVNLMAGIPDCGPAHTDNPLFRGRDRLNTPMLLLRTMHWSGLFTEWETAQATSIWWMDDVEGGGILFWPEGPDELPHVHSGSMSNTALIGDNHGMFHQVEPVGPFDQGEYWVTRRAEMRPAEVGQGDWVVLDKGAEVFRAPIEEIRVSVLLKADVFPTEEERQRVSEDVLSMDEVARLFDQDLKEKQADLRFDRDRVDDLAFLGALASHYQEPLPRGARKSIFD
ncbi:MAG: hypothetical protein VX252_17375 [Myxococcota bacterium]|nr:hypothetical protein [Myxococcota bacterium]